MSGSQALEVNADTQTKQGALSARAGLRSKWALIGGFCVAFTAAYLGLLCIASFFAAGRSSFSESGGAVLDDVFDGALIVNAPGIALRVLHAPALNPSPATDFLFYIWFKLREPLDKEQRASLVAKYDPQSKERSGYGISLAGGPDGVRPQVYWQDKLGQGRWYTFAATQIKAQQWYLLALSMREHKFLGLHLAALADKGKPIVLGGYSIESSELPDTSADLLVGAFGSSTFRGRIGPFGIIQSQGFSDDISSFIRTMAQQPLVLPDSVTPEQVALWASPKKDRGAMALTIQPGKVGHEQRKIR